MQVQGAAADLEADRDRQLVEFVQVLAVGEGGGVVHVEQFQLRGVELAARPGASFENPQQRCVGAMTGRQQQQVAGLQGAQLAGVQRQAGPLQRQAQRYGQALRRGARRQACQQRRGIAVEPERQALVVAFQAQAQAHRSAWLRRAQAVPDQAGKDVAFALQQGQLQGRRQAGEGCLLQVRREPAGQRRGLAEKAQGQAVPRQAQFEIDVGGGLGDVQARLQSVADIVATATCETSLEIQFGAAGERQVEVRTVHSACHSSCR
ncbi:hypothetical protein PAERUG_P45_London_17_VIM_2_12_12_01774 [Pseudomonas aeruginosa]|nr:hypothetical protein PAERUG_E7_London_9_VIM_2_02_13_01505 [Pseudomonas aeruginosa]CRQ80473.1 hypothetical protein PAERUG_P45_London_17_VIM_2_12_12_01774 [Pseudomonas aeruginosa]CRS22105.1 hypothetical protein PAERUG_P48_London_17_VIM_2_01_13_05714 [Pseudomonas aeruginosa]